MRYPVQPRAAVPPLQMSSAPTDQPSVSVVVPTLNAEPFLPDLMSALSVQQPAPPREIIIIDSESTDDTRSIAGSFPGVRVETIADFSHGRARNLGARLAQTDIVVFMSQDAAPADESWLAGLVDPMADPNVVATFSRQVPRNDASPMERHFLATHFPADRAVYAKRNGQKHLMFQRGFFLSNVSSAVRCSEAREHPFDESLIMSEDQQFARDVLMAGHAVVYAPGSIVIHSHHYSFGGAAGRYFDSVYSLTKIFPKHSLSYSVAMGVRYLRGEAWMMLRKHPMQIPRYFWYVVAKTTGTFLGHFAEKLPRSLARGISVHPEHWTNKTSAGGT